MTGIVNWLICIFEKFFYMVEDGIIWAINKFIVGMALIITAILAILPNMPALPALPTTFTTVEGWIAWFWPVGTTVTIFAFIVTAWIIWLGVSIALRWAKALNA